MSNDYFRFKQFLIKQDQCAMKVGVDGVLLGAWAANGHSLPINTILDIGTGTGVIALMMAQRFSKAYITAIESEEQASLQATENVANSPFSQRISVIHTALQEFNSTPFDVIVCNPPYFSSSLLSPDDRRNIARHDKNLTLSELSKYAYDLLSECGLLCVITPFISQKDIDNTTLSYGLRLKKRCDVVTKEGKMPIRTMSEYIKDNRFSTDLFVEHTTITIGSPQYCHLTKDFYLNL